CVSTSATGGGRYEEGLRRRPPKLSWTRGDSVRTPELATSSTRSYAGDMLRHRLFFGAILIATLVGLVYADSRLAESAAAHAAPRLLQRLGLLTLDGVLIAAVVVVLVVVGTRELHGLLTDAGHAPLYVWPILANVALVLTPFVAANGLPADAAALHAADTAGTLTVLMVAFIGTAVGVAARRKTAGATAAIGTTLFMIFYLGVLPQFVLRLRVFGPVGSAWLLLYFIATVKVCDIGAYFTGLAFGRTPLIAWLSPKKTIEGLAGGVAASVLFAVAVPWLAGRIVGSPGSPDTRFPDLLTAAIFGATMALVGQAGDLLESLIKRDARAKDSARAIPAFGGALDLMDSPLLAAPVACWMLLQ
ncbi:MAG: phosphatidate cytidylyltransferase, partial [Phycisphaerae bacterium]